jgi:hypothetical protein
MATNRTKPYPLFRDLAELALTSASEPQINLHFPLFRHAGSRASTRKHKQRSEVAVVVKTYDMRGRIGLIEDEMREAVDAFVKGDREKLRGCMKAARLHAEAAIAAVDTEVPALPGKPV